MTRWPRCDAHALLRLLLVEARLPPGLSVDTQIEMPELRFKTLDVTEIEEMLLFPFYLSVKVCSLGAQPAPHPNPT
jgi:hypothetical protein